MQIALLEIWLGALWHIVLTRFSSHRQLSISGQCDLHNVATVEKQARHKLQNAVS